jgi:hypothetical protein
MRIHHILGIAALLVSAACSKNLPLQPASFGVTVDSTSFTRGSTAIFSFTGNPDNIVFYSGTWGNRYAYADRIADTSGTDTLTFSTAINTAGASGALSLMISTDFSGDTAQFASATWTDVSTFAPINWATGATTTPSGSIGLTGYKSVGKPIYLAFKYSAAVGVTQAKWTISAINLLHRPLGDTAYTILNGATTNAAYVIAAPPLAVSPGWVAVNASENTVAAQLWAPLVSTSSTTTLVIAGSTTAATATASTQWMVAGPIDLTRVLHDVPTAVVKNIASLSAQSLAPPCSFKYTLPGTYSAVFVGSNTTTDGSNSAVKTISIPVQ